MAINFSLILHVVFPECTLDKVEGPCKGSWRRYYYNTLTKRCEEFIYGGCSGNANNFRTLQECQAVCAACVEDPTCPVGCATVYETDPDTGCTVCKCVSETNRCDLDKDPGPCTNYVERFYFNNARGQCESFTYGGCGGNENRFGTLAECRSVCLGVSCPLISCPSYCLIVINPTTGCDECKCDLFEI